jgi:hypothetical protein
MASRSRSTRLVLVVMEVAADVAVEDMAEAAVVEDMEAEAMAAAVAVVDMEVVDMVEMVVATEEAVEAAVATAVAAVAMEVAATEVDAVVAAVATEAVATRPPWTKTTFKRSIFDLRFPFMHISYYSAMQYCHSKTVFFLHLKSDHFSPKLQSKTL